MAPSTDDTMSKSSTQMTKPTKKTRIPICTCCGYNLTGLPIQDGRFTCPECDKYLTVQEAQSRPYYIRSLTKPTLIASLPPAAMLVLGIAPVLLLSTTDSRANYTAFFVLFSPVALVWCFVTAILYATQTRKYKGPKRLGGPTSVFLSIWIASTAILCVALVPTWLLAFAIFAGSSF